MQEGESHALAISMHMEYCLNIIYMKMIEYGIITLFFIVNQAPTIALAVDIKLVHYYV